MSALLKRDAVFPDPSPLAGRDVYMAAAGRAVDAYRSTGAIVITEELHDTPEAWRRGLLSAREIDRLEGFLFARDRNLYLAAHSLKRIVLAGITGRAAKDLAFRTNAAGRPFLMLGGWQGDFNLSHSGRRVALSVVARGRVGVDIQEPGDRYADLHEKLRHPGEVDLFPDQTHFLRMWTLKEAISKAIGTGVAERFETLRIEQSPMTAGLYNCNGWSCRHLELDDGYHLSVASNLARMPRMPHWLEPSS